jgi:hypothetical protein
MFMRSGSPPTLWCDLMVTEGPPEKDTLSITSGIERALGEEIGAADLAGLFLEHSMNSRPMVLRLVSGSASPSSASMNGQMHPPAPAECCSARGTWRPPRAASFFRIRP